MGESDLSCLWYLSLTLQYTLQYYNQEVHHSYLGNSWLLIEDHTVFESDSLYVMTPG